MFYVFLFLAALTNGGMDAIDHHKAVEPLGDLWHLLKYAFMLSLIGAGATLKSTTNNKPVVFYTTLTLSALIIFKVFVWELVYTEFYEVLVAWDGRNLIDLGFWPWLEKFLGFHN